MTGFDVYARIREHAPVVIMISGHGDIALAVQALQSGRREFPDEAGRAGAPRSRGGARVREVRLRQLNQYLSERRGGIDARRSRSGARP